MKLEVGDLVVVQDECKFKEAIDSFYEKWEIGSASPKLIVMGSFRRATTTGMNVSRWPSMVLEKQTGKSITIKYYGYSFKQFDQIVGVVTEVIQEDHRDFDVIRIREQSGGVRYCRRYILENAQELS